MTKEIANIHKLRKLANIQSNTKSTKSIFVYTVEFTIQYFSCIFDPFFIRLQFCNIIFYKENRYCLSSSPAYQNLFFYYRDLEVYIRFSGCNCNATSVSSARFLAPDSKEQTGGRGPLETPSPLISMAHLAPAAAVALTSTSSCPSSFPPSCPCSPARRKWTRRP